MQTWANTQQYQVIKCKLISNKKVHMPIGDAQQEINFQKIYYLLVMMTLLIMANILAFVHNLVRHIG